MHIFLSHPKTSQGFTLMEMMIALLVLAVLGVLSYNPLLSIYQAQKSKTYVQEVMNQLRAVQQQAIANHQASEIQFTHSVSGTQHTLTIVQTINPGTPTSVTVDWDTQTNSDAIALKINNVPSNNPVLKMSSRGDWLDVTNNALNNFGLTHGNYGLKIENGVVKRCEVGSTITAMACL